MGQTTLHATAVALEGQAALICGKSGSGKSALALGLLALGAGLIADDSVIVEARDGVLWARCPEATRGMIEARHVGLLAAPAHGPAPVKLVIDMDKVEEERLPPFRKAVIEGVEITSLHKVEAAHFPAAIALYLRGDRVG